MVGLRTLTVARGNCRGDGLWTGTRVRMRHDERPDDSRSAQIAGRCQAGARGGDAAHSETTRLYAFYGDGHAWVELNLSPAFDGQPL